MGICWGRLVPVLLFCAVFVPRLLLLHVYTASPYYDVFGWDPRVYDDWAAEVAQGALRPQEAFHQPPLYPYALGALYAVMGREPYGVFLLQAVLAGLTGVMLYRLGRDLFGRAAGAVALGLFALHGLLAFYTVKLLSETLIIFLYVWIVRVLVRAYERLDGRGWAWAGLLVGVAITGKPNMLLFAPLALVPLVWARGVSWARRGCLALAFLALAAVPVAPVIWANYVAEGDWIFVSWNGGGNLLSGNNPGASGFPSSLPGVSADRVWRPVDEREVVSAALGRRASAGEISAYWSAQATAFMREQPGEFARVLGRKLRMALSPVEHEHMYYLTYERRLFTPLLWGFPLHFGLVLPLALAGMVLAAPQWRRHWPLYAMLAAGGATLMVFYVMVRLRLPMEPFLILFAAHAVVQLASRAALGWARRVALAVLVAGGALELGLWHTDRGWYRAVEGVNTYNLGELYFEAGRYADAEAAYRRALALNPNENYVGLGFCKLLVAANRHADAVNLYRTMLPEMDADLRRAFWREKALAAIRPAMDEGSRTANERE